MSFLNSKEVVPIFLDDRTGGSGLTPGETVTTELFLGGIQNGRIQGDFSSSSPGVLTIEAAPAFPLAAFGSPDNLTYTIPLDPDQPNYHYDFTIIIVLPAIRITFQDSGAGSTYFRARVAALPLG